MTSALPLIESGHVRGACPHDCPDTCATIVTVENGRAVRIQGDPDHPVTQGFLCAKVNRYLERTYHPERLEHPLRRVGPKGSGKFERVSWEEAIADISARLRDVIAKHGAESVLPYSYAGTMGFLQGESMDRRFFHKLGASKLDRTICSTAGAAGMKMSVGGSIGADAESLPDSDLVLLWGTNTLTANPHLWPFVLKARERGAPVICIDPIRTRTAEQCDEWIPIRPGTDAALALGMMHVVFAENLQDDDYIAKHTIGIAPLRERAAEWTPERTSTTTGISAATIVSLAQRYGRAKAAFVRINYGLQRHAGGGMAVRTIACLPAVVGHWRRPGGGVQLSTSLNFRFNTTKLHRADLSPAVRTINMVRLGDALTLPDAGVGGPPVKALVVYNSNPGAIAPDLVKVRNELGRASRVRACVRDAQPSGDCADRRSTPEHRDLPPARVSDGAHRCVFQGRRPRADQAGARHRSSAHAHGHVRRAHGTRMGAAQRARAVRAVRDRRLSHAERQVRVLQ